ncbi:MAG TPA: Uma2 family endonuclease [Acidobacteriaceae bacterium]|jgi:Uma2 family endonuclease|nr:Uma2 family endonuclease [Acidobacteriaceae bacterium]
MSAQPSLQPNQFFRADEVASSGILLRSVSFPLILRPSRPLNDDQLLEFCAANDSLRIERNAAGELIVMTPAGGTTSNLEGYLFRELDLFVEREGRGVAFNSNGGFSLRDGSVRAPDAAWVSSENWNRLSREERAKFLPFCPEFVIELRSPSDSLSDLEQKMADWLANGAQLAWLIDPQRKLAVIYRPGQEPETRLQPEFLHGEGPVAGFALKMQRLWE